ncbi:DUF6580 family putative transport protein [Emticicia sp. 21SJ11W-3]|uniref:DUF6580 family putative transport protein n=1 Tax=Emticicia sp. 21SJ11W-3 TaxID=2916755 RepID=UPI00209DBDD7|nr:DUF6580 family putative transport protein [Emticicia sp. 21SJ11W-3]UTA69879.1 hypothetical protein MB380_08700 [Emticicia sp. 21SJ11W-3]
MNITRFSTIVAIIVLAAIVRILPHPFNFTPMAALALFGGAYFTNRWVAIAIPMAAMLLSDTMYELLTGWGFHSGMPVTYGSFLLVTLIGIFFLNKVSVLRVTGASLASSTIFYLITNFAFLYPEAPVPNPILGNYPHNWTGILASYNAGLEFYQNQILGDLFYSGVLFGGFYLLQRRFAVLRMA